MKLSRGAGIGVDRLEHQKASRIGGDIKGRTIAAFEQRDRLTNSDAGSGQDRHGHEAVSSAVEQLPTIAAPAGLDAAVRRNLPFATARRIRHEVNLFASRLG